jgi:crotonobetainyl-CoA:carnitine CoA-transferase CaiB-like acyl-CoA transferase
VGTYRTQDGGFIALSCLQGFHYWPGACRAIGREDLIVDERFASNELLATNAGAARAILATVFSSAPLVEWRERLAGFDGQWSVAQDTLEAVQDPQVEANGYVLETVNAAGVPFSLVTAPVQFSGSAATPRRAPEFNEHRDEVLASLGYSTESILELAVEGVVA